MENKSVVFVAFVSQSLCVWESLDRKKKASVSPRRGEGIGPRSFRPSDRGCVSDEFEMVPLSGLRELI